jgi:RHS repeat-associated protein
MSIRYVVRGLNVLTFANALIRACSSHTSFHLTCALVLAFLSVVYSPRSFAQGECTAPGSTAGYDCTDIGVSNWSYTAYPPTGSNVGPFRSESEAVSALIARVANANFCTITFNRITYDDDPSWGQTPQYQGQIDVLHGNTIHLDIVGNTGCVNSWTQGYTLRQARGIHCLTGFTIRYPNGDTSQTPYCRRLRTAENKSKAAGSCQAFSASQQQGLWRGNPCELLNGNKYQREVDYDRKDSTGLEFVRSYNSLVGDIGHMGNGWMGSYFQVLRISPGPYFNTVFAWRPDGRILAFKASGTTYFSDADVADELTAIRDLAGIIIGWTYRTADNTLETYDANGRLQSIAQHGVPTITLTYDSVGKTLIKAANTLGHSLHFGYQGSYKLARVTDAAGVDIQYSTNSNGKLSGVLYQDGRSRSYGYTSTSLLTSLTDENGVAYASWTYNASGQPASSQHVGTVQRYTFSYSGTSRIVVDPLNQSRTYTTTLKEGLRRLASAPSPCNGCGTDKTLVYDGAGRVTSRTDFENIVTQYAYDTLRNLETSRTEAFGTSRARTTDTQWHPLYRLPTQVDEPGKRTMFSHDADGNVLTRTVLDTTTSESRTWTYTYNGVGQVLTADGPRTDAADITTYTYYGCTTGYQCGQIETITNALGQVTTYNTYNAHGQPLTITDPNGVVTTLTYDPRQRLISRTVGSEQTTFEYWPTGLLKKATLPDGSFIAYTYDAAHRLTGLNDSQGNRIAYTLDAMGNRTKEDVFDPANALTQTRTRVFNTLNRLTQEIAAAGTPAVTTTFGYDDNGNQTSINAPLARNTAQGYDELNRLTQVTDPATGLTQYGYNALDQLISVTDPRNKITSYTYNALGDLTQQVSPDTGTTVQTYDSGGNLKTKTDARNKTGTYSYDALNRVTQLVYPDQTITYGYDQNTNGKGRLTSLSDGSGSTSFSYDALGRVTSRQQTVDGVSKVIGYSYDTAGQLRSVTLPSGNAVSYSYVNGKIASLTLNGSTTIISGVLYLPFGPTMGWTWGNATLAVREYDADGNITDLDSAGLRTYSYDNAFRITGITDTTASLSQTYGYDLLDRLTSAAGTSLNQSWTYDANGNRLTEGGSASSTYTVSTTNNRLNAVSGALSRTYAYDAAGNVTADGSATYTYDDAGRMVSVTKASVATTYKLNALGQRVRKTTAGVSTYFVYDDTGHLVGEYDNSGALIQETIWFDDIPVGVLKPNGSGGVNLFYVHTDHLNAPRRISRPSDNAIVWRWDSDPFGTTAANQDPDGDSNVFAYSLRLPGQYFDSETGVHYNYFRDYDPATGRYVESDPIGLKGGVNTYSYVGNDPVLFIDPDGLRARVCCRLIPFVGLVGARHCYIERQKSGEQQNSVELPSYGARESFGLIGDSGGPRSRSGDIYGNNGFDVGGECGPWTDECGTDDCVSSAVNGYPNPSNYRFASGPNSNTFAGTVARKCNLVRPSVMMTPGWGDAPATQRIPMRYRPPVRLGR